MTKDYAVSLVKSYTGYRGAGDAAVVDAIAERMVAHGEGVWHATAQVVRGGLGCNCVPCQARESMERLHRNRACYRCGARPEHCECPDQYEPD